MKTNCSVLLTVLGLMMCGSVQELVAQDYIPIFSQNYRSRLSMEIDPLTFLMRGYSLHVRYQPMYSKRVQIGAGVFAMDVPASVADLHPSNRNMGWDARIRSAFMLAGEYYFREANQGWFVGEQIGFHSYKVVSRQEATATANFNNLVLMTSLGYNWHPYKGSFYIKPWAGIGYVEKVDGITRAGNLNYHINRWMPFVTFHAGYNF